MSTIYTLPAEVEQALELYYSSFDPDTGEQTASDEEVAARQAALDELMNRANENLEWYCADIANRNARLAGLKTEIERLTKLAKSEQRRAESGEALVDRAFSRIYQGKPVAFGNFTLSYRKSEGVRIDDEKRLPESYLRVKTDVDKAAIRADLKAGKEIPGASLETRQNLSIR